MGTAGPEKKVKDKLRKSLKEMGAYEFMPATGGYGRSGIPDVVGCYRGYFFAFECKAGKNKPTALQYKELSKILGAGGFAAVVNEDRVGAAAQMLEEWVSRQPNHSESCQQLDGST